MGLPSTPENAGSCVLVGAAERERLSVELKNETNLPRASPSRAGCRSILCKSDGARSWEDAQQTPRIVREKCIDLIHFASQVLSCLKRSGQIQPLWRFHQLRPAKRISSGSNMFAVRLTLRDQSSPPQPTTALAIGSIVAWLPAEMRLRRSDRRVFLRPACD